MVTTGAGLAWDRAHFYSPARQTSIVLQRANSSPSVTITKGSPTRPLTCPALFTLLRWTGCHQHMRRDAIDCETR